tara:strand:+ start:1603 stop:1902 length:300 start_codon:yes stop_codon:yes gene_type:complete
MALELDYEEERLGVTIPNVYAKIVRASFDNMENDEGVNVNYTVKLYKNEEAKEEGEPPFGGKSFITTLNIGNAKTQYNLLKQCYLHLKTMDGFTDAADS